MTGYRAAHTANTSTAASTNDWRQRAACRDKEPDLFFSSAAEGSKPYLADVADAKAVCRRCRVTADCLLWALDNRCDDGVWGGTAQEERRELKPRHPQPPPLIDRIRDLAGRGLSDPEIAARLDAGIGWKRVQALRLGARIPAGRNPAPFRTEGAA